MEEIVRNLLQEEKEDVDFWNEYQEAWHYGFIDALELVLELAKGKSEM